MLKRTLTLLFILVSLSLSIEPYSQCENILPQLEIVKCQGGPSPQVAGQIVDVFDAENGEILVFTRFPQQVYRFKTGVIKPLKVIDCSVSLPIAVILSDNSFVCAMEVQNEDGFYQIVKFSLDDGKRLAESERISSELFQLAYTPLTKRVVSASNTGEIRSWSLDLQSSELIKKVDGVFSISLDQTGSRLVIYTPNKYSEILDLTNNAQILTNKENSYAKVIMLGASTKAVANTFGRGVVLLDMQTGKELHTCEGGVKIKDIAVDMLFSTLFVSHVDGRLLRFDITGDLPKLIDSMQTGYRGGNILCVQKEHLTIWTDYSFDSYTLPQFDRLFSAEVPKLFLFFALSPSGEFFAGFHDDKIFLYSLQGGFFTPLRNKLILEIGMIDLRAMFFVENDKLLLVGGTKTGILSTSDFAFKPLFDFPQSILTPSPRFCCSNGKLVVIGKDSEIVVYDLATGNAVANFLPVTFVEEAVVSSDLSLIACRAVPSEIYRLDTGKRVYSLRKGLFDMAFSPDDKMLIGYNNDGVVAVDIEKLEIAFKIHVPGTVERLIVGAKKAIAFSNKGVYLVNLADKKVISAAQKDDFEVKFAEYRNGTCVYQDSDSNIFKLSENLD